MDGRTDGVDAISMLDMTRRKAEQKSVFVFLSSFLRDDEMEEIQVTSMQLCMRCTDGRGVVFYLSKTRSESMFCDARQQKIEQPRL